MAVTAARSPGTVSRNRFMLGVLTAGGAAIALTYVGVILRYLYPKSSDTPPLKVALSEAGVVDPLTKQILPFQNGVAGPFNYPTVVDKSVVVGVFIEKINATGPLATDNIRVVDQTCRHLGCPVTWVPTDNKFECPCHGSQYYRNLQVSRGPAADPLWQHKFILAPDASSITIEGRE
ncbi:MAG TPA: Rieske 2Fe-2S domain-containing protein [Chloroflexota bacterium]|nr:Rieske 2Fe-2S domain-containing protein [Chloroflexota bacterium]